MYHIANVLLQFVQVFTNMLFCPQRLRAAGVLGGVLCLYLAQDPLFADLVTEHYGISLVALHTRLLQGAGAGFTLAVLMSGTRRMGLASLKNPEIAYSMRAKD
jgi:hypothetical protein